MPSTIRTGLYKFRIEDHIAVTTPRDDATDVDGPDHPEITDPTAYEEISISGYYREPSQRTILNWKKKLGEYMVKDIIAPEMERRGWEWPKERVVQGRLRSFPKHYKLLTHISTNDGRLRQDHYLFCAKGRFQSPAEFGPHLAWLLQGQPRDKKGKTKCACCYCNMTVVGGRAKRPRTSQKAITQERYGDLDDYFTRPVKRTKRAASDGSEDGAGSAVDVV